MEHLCRTCGSNGPFYPAYIKNHNYLCKDCANKSVKRCRDRDPIRLMTYRTYNSSRKNNEHNVVTYEFVSDILKRWNYKSVISDEKDLNKLCIVHYFRDLQLSSWNSVVLTRVEARRFSHLKTRIYDEFPKEVREWFEYELFLEDLFK